MKSDSTRTSVDSSSSTNFSIDSGRPLLSIPYERDAFSSVQFDRRRAYYSRDLLALAFTTVLGTIAALVLLDLMLALICGRSLSTPSSGLQKSTTAWHTPADSVRLLSFLDTDFSGNVTPKSCHSHNDYWHKVPLYDALAAGCTGVEADIWLPDASSSNTTNLRVGHSHSTLTANRTLSSLFIQPLATILHQINLNSTEKPMGVFTTDENVTIALLLDFKSNGVLLWPLVQQALEPLRQPGWLRHWNGTLNATIPGPLTIVASGNAPFDLIMANNTYRDVFFDAPLGDIASPLYNESNSYYASASLHKALGRSWFGHFSAKQMKILNAQVKEAARKGLLSRYWGTPKWSVSMRDRVWDVLVKSGVGILNVDDLDSVARWNRDWCVVRGVRFCS